METIEITIKIPIDKANELSELVNFLKSFSGSIIEGRKSPSPAPGKRETKKQALERAMARIHNH